MKIPKQIKIGGKLVNVMLVSGEEHFPDDESGMSFLKQNIIKIDNQMNIDEQSSTLLHEIIEFINEMYELKLNHKTITCLETSLYQVLHDNKLKF